MNNVQIGGLDKELGTMRCCELSFSPVPNTVKPYTAAAPETMYSNSLSVAHRSGTVRRASIDEKKCQYPREAASGIHLARASSSEVELTSR